MDCRRILLFSAHRHRSPVFMAMQYAYLLLFMVRIVNSKLSQTENTSAMQHFNWKTFLRCGSNKNCQPVGSLVLPYANEGLQNSLNQCQRQFSGDRWNCSPSSIKAILQTNCREGAFLRAIAAAGVAHSTARACSAGKLSEHCKCQQSLMSANHRTMKIADDNKAFASSTCRSGFEFGLQTSKSFLDKHLVLSKKSGLKQNLRTIVQLHNNQVGRRVLQQLASTECKCHGISGACTTKTCWQAMPKFKPVGAQLKQLYSKAEKVHPSQAKQLFPGLEDGYVRHHDVGSSTLLFCRKSPNFCKRKHVLGLLGTAGRQCQADLRAGPKSCAHLCCGRGHRTEKLHHIRDCRCKFHWCCHIKCEKCIVTTEKHFCL